MPLEFAEESRFVLNGWLATATRAQLDKLAVDCLNLSPRVDRRAAAWAFPCRSRNDCLAALAKLG